MILVAFVISLCKKNIMDDIKEENSTVDTKHKIYINRVERTIEKRKKGKNLPLILFSKLNPTIDDYENRTQSLKTYELYKILVRSLILSTYYNNEFQRGVSEGFLLHHVYRQMTFYFPDVSNPFFFNLNYYKTLFF